MGRVCILGLAVAAAFAPSRADGYEPRETHRWLTRAAAEHLASAYPGEYDELLDYVDTVAEGSEHEDNLFAGGSDDPETLRVMRHFYRPTDGAGLYLEDRGAYRSSLEWARPNDENAWHWGNGIDAYAQGDKDEAYFVLGHIVHLVQDLTVPAHTHLDEHPPPAGDDFENYAAEQMIGEHDSFLPTPPEDAPVPEFDSLAEAWRETAQASYYRNLYPGNLEDPDEPRGAVAEMFPDLEMDGLRGAWYIGDPPIGMLGEGFFEAETTPRHYYFKTTEYAAELDYAEFDRDDPGDFSGLAANEDGARMVELLARDLIPVAILHSAGVMKLYLDEAYTRAPDQDDRGDDLPPGGRSGLGCAALPGAQTATSWPFALVVLLWITFRRAR